MNMSDKISCAGESEPVVKVSGVRPMEDYKLWLRFNTGEAKIFDFRPLLDTPAFAPLKNTELFKQVYIDYGVPVWNDGDIDIAPEKVYREGILCDGQKRRVNKKLLTSSEAGSFLCLHYSVIQSSVSQ